MDYPTRMRRTGTLPLLAVLAVLLPTLFGARLAFAQLAGTYTVGPSGDYASLQDAFDDLDAQGVSGPVTLDLLSGTYTLTGTQTLSLGTDDANGTSATNTITIQAQSGNAADVVLEYTNAGFVETPLLRLDGADHVTVQHLTFRPLLPGGSGYALGLQLQGEVEGIVIQDNRFEGVSGSNGAGTRALVGGASLVSIDAVAITGNTFTSGTGISLSGQNFSQRVQAEITGNTFDDPYEGIVLHNAEAPVIQQNTFAVGSNSATFNTGIISVQSTPNAVITDNTMTGTVIGTVGIRCSDCDEALQITNNRIEVTTCGKGIDVESSEGNGSTGLIANNRIAVTGTACGFQATQGLRVFGTAQNVVHNTVLLHGLSSASSYACSLFGGGGGSTFQNNLCVVEGAGIPLELLGTVDSDYNGYYTPGASLARLNSGEVPSLAALQAEAGTDANSVVAFPGLADTDPSDGTFDLTPASPWYDDEGTNLTATVPADAEGANRAATPSIGALEYSAAATKLTPGTTLTVGASGDYATLQEAFDDLQLRGLDDGQTGPTTLALQNGTHTGQAVLPPYAGGSADRPLVLTSASGTAADATLQFTMPDEQAEQFLLKLIRPSHITIEHLTLTLLSEAATPRGRGIVLEGFVDGLTIQDNIFNGLDGTGFNNGLLAMVYGLDVTAPDPITITGNAFTHGTGIYLDGTTDSFGAPAAGTSITDNTFAQMRTGIELEEITSTVTGNTVTTTGNGGTGIRLESVPDAEVTGNTVTGADGAALFGISCTQCSGTAQILKNRITLDGYGSGIAVTNSSNFDATQGLIANNAVAIRSSGRARGLDLSNSNQRVYHNSFLVEDASTQAIALLLSGAGGSDVRNNIVALLGTGTVVSGDPSALTLDYNNLFGGSTLLQQNFSTSYATLEALQAAGFAEHSMAVPPGFDADLKTDSPWLDDEGVDLTGDVPDDLDGTTRTAPVSLGAYEYESTTTKIAPGTTLTVGPGEDYTDLQAALADLQLRGFDEAQTGTVTLSLADGAYAGPFTLLAVPGSASDRPLVVTSTSGEAADVVLQREATEQDDNYVLRLVGAGHVTVRHLTIQPQGNDLARGIELAGALTSIVLDQLVFTGPAAGGTNAKALLYGRDVRLTGGLQITGSTFRSGGIGVYLTRNGTPEDAPGIAITGSTFENLARGIELTQVQAPVLEDNTLSGITDQAVTLSNITGAQIIGNTVEAQEGLGLTSLTAPVIEGNTVTTTERGIICICGGALRITRNTIRSGSTAMSLDSHIGSSDRGIVANNVLIAQTASGAFSTPGGLRVTSATLDVYHNSVAADGTACYVSVFNGTPVFQNNICATRGSGYALEINGTADSDYNNFFTTGPVLAWKDGQTALATLADLQSETGTDANSLSIFPAFNEDLTTDSPWLDDAGTDLTGTVDEDIDGTARPASPSLGAHQYTSSGAPYAPGTTITVGTGGDVATLAEGLNALLTFGVAAGEGGGKAAAPVTLALEAGTHAGGLTIPPIPGATAETAVVLASSTDDAADVTIEHAADTTFDNFVLRLLGTRHLTLRDLTLEATESIYGRVLVLEGTTENLTITGNRFIGVDEPEDASGSSASDRIVVVAAAGSFDGSSWQPVNGLTITDNTFEQGSNGLRLAGDFNTQIAGITITGNTFEGQSDVTLSLENLDAPVIENNTLRQVAAAGIQLQNAPGALLRANTVALTAPSGNTFTAPVGIQAASAAGLRVEGNTITAEAPSNRGYTGLQVTFGSGDADPPVLVANNVISLTGPGQTLTGLLANTSNVGLYHNSVSITGAQGNNAVACRSGSGADQSWQNNICAAFGGGLALRVSNPTGITLDFNNYYATGTLAVWENETLATLADLQAKGTDANSTSIYPAFDADLMTNSWWLDDEGTNLTGIVDEDFAGTARPSSPSLGAYQYTSTVTPFVPGTYSVGAGGTYPDLTAAVDALLAAGIATPDEGAEVEEIVFAIEAGTYEGRYTVPELPGSNAARPVVFASASGDSTDVILTHAATTEANNFLFHLAGTDYVTFRSLTMEATGEALGRVFLIEGQVRALQIVRSVVRNPVGEAPSSVQLASASGAAATQAASERGYLITYRGDPDAPDDAAGGYTEMALRLSRVDLIGEGPGIELASTAANQFNNEALYRPLSMWRTNIATRGAAVVSNRVPVYMTDANVVCDLVDQTGSRACVDVSNAGRLGSDEAGKGMPAFDILGFMLKNSSIVNRRGDGVRVVSSQAVMMTGLFILAAGPVLFNDVAYLHFMFNVVVGTMLQDATFAVPVLQATALTTAWILHNTFLFQAVGQTPVLAELMALSTVAGLVMQYNMFVGSGAIERAAIGYSDVTDSVIRQMVYVMAGLQFFINGTSYASLAEVQEATGFEDGSSVGMFADAFPTDAAALLAAYYVTLEELTVQMALTGQRIDGLLTYMAALQLRALALAEGLRPAYALALYSAANLGIQPTLAVYTQALFYALGGDYFTRYLDRAFDDDGILVMNPAFQYALVQNGWVTPGALGAVLFTQLLQLRLEACHGYIPAAKQGRAQEAVCAETVGGVEFYVTDADGAEIERGWTGWVDQNGNGRVDPFEDGLLVLALDPNEHSQVNVHSVPPPGYQLLEPTGGPVEVDLSESTPPPIPFFFNNHDDPSDTGWDYDWGDLPDTYVTTGGGPRHKLAAGDDEIDARLGALIDPEDNGQPSPTADGDDQADANAVDDEDGLVSIAIRSDGSIRAEIDVTLDANTPEAYLNAWVDFDLSGTFTVPGEQVFASERVTSGRNTLTTAPGIADPDGDISTVRLRLVSHPGFIHPVGAMIDGEVEDYLLYGVDFGDAPAAYDPNRPAFPGGYPTTLAQNGARHVASNRWQLGDEVDPDGQPKPNVYASGDDEDNQADEDGILFPAAEGWATILTLPNPQRPDGGMPIPSTEAGNTPSVIPLPNTEGRLDAWIDFNRDGDWDDAGEQVVQNESIEPTNPPTALPIAIPEDAAGGFTYARFRFSQNGGLSPRGAAPNGEVEDYLLFIGRAQAVTSDGDDGDANPGDGVCDDGTGACSLRAAIEEANATSDIDVIDLREANGGKQALTIQPQRPLPAITESLVLTGEGATLDGSQAGDGADGLTLAGGGSLLQGLAITGFDGHGLVINSVAGTLADGLTITDNGGDGIRVVSGTGHTLRRNRIAGNGGLGIDLGGDGLTANDADDSDDGPNNRQNFPELTSVTAGDRHIAGTLTSMPEQLFTLDFFASTTCDASGNGEGATYLGSATVETDASGQATLAVTLETDLTTGQFVTATATAADGNTSEFSACATVGQGTPVEDAEIIPETFELHANYPNPFNPQTTITFDAPQQTQVRLTVFDMLGRRVTVLVDGPMAPGRHQVSFDASRLASGVYFYRIEMGDFRKVRKMLLVK